MDVESYIAICLSGIGRPNYGILGRQFLSPELLNPIPPPFKRKNPICSMKTTQSHLKTIHHKDLNTQPFVINPNSSSYIQYILLQPYVTRVINNLKTESIHLFLDTKSAFVDRNALRLLHENAKHFRKKRPYILISKLGASCENKDRNCGTCTICYNFNFSIRRNTYFFYKIKRKSFN